MSTFSGSLPSKKKYELQEIATALDISEAGTRDELQQRIKLYLAHHETTLSEDSRFAGLYGRTRKRSVQPHLSTPRVKEDGISQSSDDHEEKTKIQTRKVSRHVARAPATPLPNDSLARVAEELDPTDLPLPPSPIPSAVVQAASAITREAGVLVQKVKAQERTMALEGRKLLIKTQGFLSDANNISSITLLVELGLILQAVFPLAYLVIPFDSPYKVDKSHSFVLAIPYPTSAIFMSLAPWLVIIKWLIPSLILPTLCGALVSFNTPPREIDPLTVGIIRVACSVASRWGIEENTLPSKYRVLNAAIGAAFAFAEAVGDRRRQR